MSLHLSRPISARHHHFLSNTARLRLAQAHPHRPLVQLTSLLFVVFIIEGIVRKWVFPGQHEYFYFLRDPIVLGLYLWALSGNTLQQKGWFALWLGVAVFTSLMSLVVGVLNDVSPQLWILGARNYFLFMPLAFIVARAFERDDIERFARLVAVLAVPIGLICLLQSFSSEKGWLNVGAGGAPPPSFADGLLRTTGVLASDAQHVMYITFSLSLLVAALVGGRSSRTQRNVLVAGVVSTATMMVVSGSRGVWLQAIGVGVVTTASFFLARASTSTRLRAIMMPLLGGLVAAALLAALPGMEAAYESRNRTARTFSSVSVKRIVATLLPSQMFEAPIVGRGIGVGTTASAAYSAKGPSHYADASGRRLTMGETDWSRNFNELGLVVGSVFVAMRIVFALWLLLISVRAARNGDPRSLILASFASLAIFNAQITMHTAYGHLTWFAVGLTMAAARVGWSPRTAPIVGPTTMGPRHGNRWPPPIKPTEFRDTSNGRSR
jgi:hypothetical protein